MILQGDCRDRLKELPGNSVDAVVCDPPYELSDGGKASPNWVALKVVFPDDPKLNALLGGEDMLALLIDKVLALGNSGSIPSPATAVPISAVALDGNTAGWQENIKDGRIAPIGFPYSETGDYSEPDIEEHLGDFALKLTDPAALFHALNSAGCGFCSGGVGIGFGILAAGFPAFLGRCGIIDDGHSMIGQARHSCPNLICTGIGATDIPVLHLAELGRGTTEYFTANGALIFAAILEAGGAQLVRTTSAASGLPPKLESRRICVIDPTTNRALSFNLISHNFSLAEKGFMGKGWDGSKIAYDVTVWQECLRVLKPGGRLLAFGGTRTSHRMVCAIEDAGFIVTDSLCWLYGSGFPKSHDISKAIDKAAGAEPEAEQWDGWGSSLKPAHEPVCLAIKPLEGTYAANVLKWGVGGLNIDGCRIGYVDDVRPKLRTGAACSKDSVTFSNRQSDGLRANEYTSPIGRWPANVVIDDEAAAMIDQQSGESKSSGGLTKGVGFGQFGQPNWGGYVGSNGGGLGDSGGASRFYYRAKAARWERDFGLEDFEAQAVRPTGKKFGECTIFNGENGDNEWKAKNPNNPARNPHPTVKPVALLRWLVRLVTPPNGTVLDPFAGSGSCGIAAKLEGFNYVGIELDPSYCAIAEARIAAWQVGSKQDEKTRPQCGGEGIGWGGGYHKSPPVCYHTATFGKPPSNMPTASTDDVDVSELEAELDIQAQLPLEAGE